MWTTHDRGDYVSGYSGSSISSRSVGFSTSNYNSPLRWHSGNIHRIHYRPI
ncbi:hypothetical protein EMCG_05249 [[Emmonsia] crescens]|uniref:Uncharacterized protein n=1 Tax=[Emmonsia] crescens TaxID=73230 RepID=A0A0G2HPP3_9EURO|nr:hypothetical protein EMCG_05249 [Emmonsia crescens UAMH 3008]